jgi:hypothetical protein
MFSCSYCTFTSNSKFCVKEHEDKNHLQPKITNTNERQIYNCSKCDKKYLTFNSAKKHEAICVGINILTCPKCMKTFTCSQHKSRHIKNNNCKARSIAYVKDIIDDTYINNYGNERLDYISVKDMLKIITSYTNAILLFINKKHFNEDFPENQNIVYDKQVKKYKIKEDGKWSYLTITLLSYKLIFDNSEYLINFSSNNKHEFENITQTNDNLSDFIIKFLITIKMKKNKEEYKIILQTIKNLLENKKLLI